MYTETMLRCYTGFRIQKIVIIFIEPNRHFILPYNENFNKMCWSPVLYCHKRAMFEYIADSLYGNIINIIDTYAF